MVEFDTTQAIMMTVTGVGAAFVAIVALIVFTYINKFVSVRWYERNAGAEVVAPPMDTAGNGDARMAAAIGVAVALAMDEAPGLGVLQRVAERGGRSTIRGWRSLGRWQGIETARTWRRPGPGRDAGRDRS